MRTDGKQYIVLPGDCAAALNNSQKHTCVVVVGWWCTCLQSQSAGCRHRQRHNHISLHNDLSAAAPATVDIQVATEQRHPLMCVCSIGTGRRAKFRHTVSIDCATANCAQANMLSAECLQPHKCNVLGLWSGGELATAPCVRVTL